MKDTNEYTLTDRRHLISENLCLDRFLTPALGFSAFPTFLTINSVANYPINSVTTGLEIGALLFSIASSAYSFYHLNRLNSGELPLSDHRMKKIKGAAETQRRAKLGKIEGSVEFSLDHII